MIESENRYEEGSIKLVTGLEHVRTRPAMYIGDVGERGLHHLVWEILDNAVDEHMAGYAKNIKLTLHPDGSISIEDDGRGIPVGLHPETGIPTVQMVFTMLGAGGKFDKKVYRYSGGLHGVGASVVNALSEWLVVEVWRDGWAYRQEYERGIPLQDVVKIGQTSKRGTKVSFKPDAQIFETTKLKLEIIERKLRELAYLNPECTFELIDEKTLKRTKLRFEKGIEELVEYLCVGRERLFDEVLRIKGEKEEVIVDIALTYTKEDREIAESFVNNIRTSEGGTHLSGFRAGLSKAIGKLLPGVKLQKELKETFTGEDLREGLVLVLSCKVPNPQFEGQTKTKLGNQNVKTIVESITYEALTELLEKKRDILRLIVDKAIQSALAREAAKKARELVKRRSSEDSSLPGKLADCSEKEASKREVFIVEGESAGGSAKQGRDRNTQAILPLRGKILNVEKARLDKVFSNEEIRAIISSLGCGIGQDLDLSKLRYHKIILMTDADVDGSHIRTLLLAFFYRYMYKLVENGHLYIAQPPLYRIKRGKTQRYLKDERELEQELFSIISENMKLIDSNSKTYSGQTLIELVRKSEELNESMTAFERSGFKEIINTLLELNLKEEDLRSYDKALECLNLLLEKLKEFKLDIKQEDREEFSIELKNSKTGESFKINTELLSSHQLRELGNFKKLEPMTIEKGSKKLTIERFEELHKVAFELAREGVELQRYKGLGEMNPEQLWETTMDPKSRNLIQVSIEDAIEADKIISMLMGEQVEQRRAFIERYAREVKNLDI
ncbi:MAG: DNA topoisomerase (ATP-hydrolyzing) subunit B [Aquificaceae bacterium]